jgi:serine/threonine-protein kinase
VIYKVVFEPHPSLAHLVPTASPRILAAVDRALAKKVADRFADMAAFVEALTGRPLMTMTGQQAGVSVPADLKPPRPAQRGEVAERSEAGEGLPRFMPEGSGPSPGGGTVGAMDATVVPAAAASLAPAGPATVAAPLAAKGQRGLWMILAGTAVVAAVVAAVVLRPLRPSQTLPSASGPATIVVPMNVPEPVRAVVADAAPLVPEPAALPQAEKKRPEKSTHSKASAREEVLPASVAAELDAAESALLAKDLSEAIRRARHSLYEKKTSRAASVLTRAFCLQGDLGSAKAELGHVAAPDRARVIKSCRAAGMEL